MKFAHLASAIALAAAAPSVASVNLITNGGFESNGGAFNTNFTGWTNSDWFVEDGSFQSTPVEGSFAASTGCVGSYCNIGQNIATVAGRSYTLSFAFNPGTDVAPVGSGQGDTQAQVNGSTVIDINGGSHAWSFYSTTFTATGATTNINFAGYQNPAWSALDAVSVTSNAPEPASWVMLIAGFGLVGAIARRRQALAA